MLALAKNVSTFIVIGDRDMDIVHFRIELLNIELIVLNKSYSVQHLILYPVQYMYT